jgi:hypothetical protein
VVRIIELELSQVGNYSQSQLFVALLLQLTGRVKIERRELRVLLVPVSHFQVALVRGE